MAAVVAATDLPCLLYNNPVAYRTDFTPEQVAELAAELPNLEAVKESSHGRAPRDRPPRAPGRPARGARGRGRRDRGGRSAAGAVGWIAGLVNAFPAESVALLRLTRAGRHEEALALYRWFLPLLRMDTVPKFVQLIKLVQERVGRGSERVRPPRLPLEGREREAALEVIERALATRPRMEAIA